MKTLTARKTIVPALLAAAFLLPTVAQAGSQAWRGDDFVHGYDRASFATEAGVTREYARLERAVEAYCRAPDGVRGVRHLQAQRDCEARVMAACERQMPKALLAEHRRAARVDDLAS